MGQLGRVRWRLCQGRVRMNRECDKGEKEEAEDARGG